VGGAHGGSRAGQLGDEEVLLVHAAEEVALPVVGGALDPAAPRVLAEDPRAGREAGEPRHLELEPTPGLVDQEDELLELPVD